MIFIKKSYLFKYPVRTVPEDMMKSMKIKDMITR